MLKIKLLNVVNTAKAATAGLPASPNKIWLSRNVRSVKNA